MTVNKITCPNCKYEGKPKHRTATSAWWAFFVIFGGISFVIGVAIPIFFIVPFFLLVAAIIGTVINSTKGTIYCPRCKFANVVPQEA